MQDKCPTRCVMSLALSEILKQQGKVNLRKLGWSDSAASRVLFLHVADPALIPDTPYDPLSLSGLILEYRARSRS